MEHTDSSSSKGLMAAVACYVIWGLLPFYLQGVHAVPAFEFVGWRIVFTVPFCLLALLVGRHMPELRRALAHRRTTLMLMLSAVLIGGNWLIYIAAIQDGHVLAASLGYYINPLANVLLGTLLFGERHSRLQWLAVAIAFAGVSLLAWEARDMLFISLALAGSFACYGMVRRVVHVSSLAGLTIEAIVLLLPASALLAWYGRGPHGISLGKDLHLDMLVALSGVVTAVPLMLFTYAARRLRFSTLGIVQYLSPTIVFVLALTWFHEPMRQVQMYSFAAIWLAIALFSWDAFQRKSGEVVQ